MKVLKPNTIPTRVSTADDRLARSTGSYSYIDSGGNVQQSTTANTARFTYNKSTLAYEGILFESSKTNLFLNSTTLSTQTVSTGMFTDATYVMSFYGTGTISYASGVAVLTGTGANTRVSAVFKSTSSRSFTVTGTVQYAQLEIGLFPTSWIPTSGSQVTRPAESFTGAVGILGTNVTDSTAVWSISTTYALGDIVQRFGRKYQSLQNSNTGNGPVGSPTWWLDIGPTNVYACLDKEVSTSTTTSSGSIEYGFRINSITGQVSAPNGISVLGVVGASAVMYPITVKVAISVENVGVIYSGSKTLNSQDERNATFFVPNLFSGNLVSVRIESSSVDSMSVSTITNGLITDLGSTQYGASSGIIDYSRKETDEFGNVTFVERAYSKRLSAQVLVPNSSLNSVQRLLYSLRATPAVWIGSDDSTYDEALTVYGFYRDFSTDIAYPAHSICNLEIEGLI